MRKYYLLLAVFFVFLASCSSFRYTVKRNDAQSIRQLNRCYKKNGNAFYLTSTYANFSVVWTYNQDGIEIYRLMNGRIKQKQVLDTDDTAIYTGESFVDINKDLYQNCPLELDGDLLVVKVKDGGHPHTESFPVDINCLKQGDYRSVFLRRIAKDINAYKLW